MSAMPPMLPMLQPRPVVEGWKCQRSGDCCTLPKEVVMTKAEAAAVVHAAPPEIKLNFRPGLDGFVAMQTGPCPLFVFGGCLVYHARPYNCRRFACMRPEPKKEKLELSGAIGCLNLEARLIHSRIARRLYQRIQSKAQAWAQSHGWKIA